MLITKCNLCGELIEDRTDTVVVGYGQRSWANMHLCANCSEPIVNYLEEQKLIKREKETIK